MTEAKERGSERGRGEGGGRLKQTEEGQRKESGRMVGKWEGDKAYKEGGRYGLQQSKRWTVKLHYQLQKMSVSQL